MPPLPTGTGYPGWPIPPGVDPNEPPLNMQQTQQLLNADFATLISATYAIRNTFSRIAADATNHLGITIGSAGQEAHQQFDEQYQLDPEKTLRDALQVIEWLRPSLRAVIIAQMAAEPAAMEMGGMEICGMHTINNIGGPSPNSVVYPLHGMGGMGGVAGIGDMGDMGGMASMYGTYGFMPNPWSMGGMNGMGSMGGMGGMSGCYPFPPNPMSNSYVMGPSMSSMMTGSGSMGGMGYGSGSMGGSRSRGGMRGRGRARGH